jgi:hypothetical protein
MAAEKIKPYKLTQSTPKQRKILQTFTENPEKTITEIAHIAKATPSYAWEVLQQYGINKKRVDDYIQNKADVFAGLQDRIISSITDEDIKKAPFGSRVLALAQLTDKERVERGLSNGDQPIMVIIRDKPQPVQVEGKVVDIPKVEQDNLLITPET